MGSTRAHACAEYDYTKNTRFRCVLLDSGTLRLHQRFSRRAKSRNSWLESLESVENGSEQVAKFMKGGLAWGGDGAYGQ